jgi:hypothetical protein
MRTRFAFGPKLRWLWHAWRCHHGHAFMQYSKVQRGWWHITHNYIWLRCGVCHQVFLGNPDWFLPYDKEASPCVPASSSWPCSSASPPSS